MLTLFLSPGKCRRPSSAPPPRGLCPQKYEKKRKKSDCGVENPQLRHLATQHPQPCRPPYSHAGCSPPAYRLRHTAGQIRRIWSANTANLHCKHGVFTLQTRRFYTSTCCKREAILLSEGYPKAVKERQPTKQINLYEHRLENTLNRKLSQAGRQKSLPKRKTSRRKFY